MQQFPPVRQQLGELCVGHVPLHIFMTPPLPIMIARSVPVVFPTCTAPCHQAEDFELAAVFEIPRSSSRIS